MVGRPERRRVTVGWLEEIHFDLPHLQLSSEMGSLTANRRADSRCPSCSNEATDAVADSSLGSDCWATGTSAGSRPLIVDFAARPVDIGSDCSGWADPASRCWPCRAVRRCSLKLVAPLQWPPRRSSSHSTRRSLSSVTMWAGYC